MTKIKKLLMSLIFLLGIFCLFYTKQTYASNIEDGEYIIKSVIDENYVIDITGNSDKNGAKVELWTNNNGNNQRFIVKKISENQYSIVAKHSGKSLDIPNFSKQKGVVLEQYTWNRGNNQLWDIIEDENGYYSIMSKCNGLYVDIANSKIAKGSDILMWNKNGGKNQKFIFQLVSKKDESNETEEKVTNEFIEDGIYQIRSALNENYVLDVTAKSKENCANIEIWRNNNQNNQKYKFKNIGNNCYEISCADSQKYLDVEGNNKYNGANLIQYKHCNVDNQRWYLRKAEGEYYYIVSKANGMCIDIEHSKCENGTNVLLWSQNKEKNQMFKLEKTTLTESGGISDKFKAENPNIKVGIDVSKYQGNIDWEKVKKDGIDYVMIRAGFRGYGESGTLNEDVMFEKNVKGAKAAGLDVGVYFFSQAKNYDEGVKEAEYTIDLIKKFNITYPVAFDTEQSSSPTNSGRADNISVKDRTNATKGFCSTIEKAGYKTLIYASPYWLRDKLDMSQLSMYKIWLAHYTGATQENPLAKPSSYKGQYVMWQYTDKGTVNGIDGGVDCNIFFYEEMR